MKTLDQYQQVELFHLCFLQFLETALPKNKYALKGGCNLRFFFSSIRYSEGIDLDIWDYSKEKLKDSINRIFSSKPFISLLSSNSITISDVRLPKQTDTTQRWKLFVEQTGGAIKIPTKIEFSRRQQFSSEQIKHEQIDLTLCAEYNIKSVLCSHYNSSAAINQKLHALLNRNETQARDIFDLHLLLSKETSFHLDKTEFVDKETEIEDRILSINFDVFSSQVLTYLEQKYFDFYSLNNRWESLQLKLIERLKVK